MSQVVELVITSPAPWMKPFVERALANRLIACAHQVVIQTTYRWDGAVHHGDEVRAAMHTTAERVTPLIDLVRELHPFEVPCVLHSHVETTSAYADWVSDCVSDPVDKK